MYFVINTLGKAVFTVALLLRSSFQRVIALLILAQVGKPCVGREYDISGCFVRLISSCVLDSTCLFCCFPVIYYFLICYGLDIFFSE